MAVILQPKRIIITEFKDDDCLSKFVRYVTVQDFDMFFNLSKEWTAAYETTYNGEPAIAVPRRFSTDFLNRVAVMEPLTKESVFDPIAYREFTNNSDPRDDEQKEMLDFLLGRNKYKALSAKPRRGLFANTGTGKTFLTLKAAAELGMFVFINCPDEKAIMTWKQEIAKFTDILPEEIGVMKGRESLPKLMKNKERYKVVLGSAKTFSSLIIGNDFDIIQEFFTEMEFGLMVHDEVHLNIIVVFFLEMITSTKRTFYLTATPGRRIYKEGKILQSLLPAEDCVYEQDIKPRFEVYKCVYHSNPQKAEHIKGLKRPRGFDYLGYGKKYLFNEKLPYMLPYLEKVLLRVVKAARKALTNKEQNKIAILCKTKEENKIVAEFLIREFPELTVGIFNSDIEDMDLRFKETDAQLIVSTDRSFAGIINIPYLEAEIILHPITSDTHLLQIAGRIREAKGKRSLVYLLVDGSFKQCLSSGNNAMGILRDYSIAEKKIELTPKITVKVDIEDL